MDELPIGPASPLVPTGDDDRYFDYCLEPYTPRRSTRGKLRGETLLWHGLEIAGATQDIEACLRAIQEHAGRDATVFGAKRIGEHLSWELYFYDPQKEEPRVRAGAVARAVEPWLSIVPVVRESVPYFMFSFNLTPEMRRGDRVESVNLYLAEPVGHAGRSYCQTERALELENTYHFFHPKRDVREVLYRIRSSVFVDWSVHDVSRVLVPELFNCNRVCVAKKRHADAVYYSGIDVDQLAWFLHRYDWPERTQRFVADHAAKLDHLRFDVGIDYVVDPKGSIVASKTSYYSTL
jgi:hypothetical protein